MKQVLKWNRHRLVGLRAADGHELWPYPLPHTGPDQNTPASVVKENRIYVVAQNRGIRCLRPGLRDGRWQVEVLWHQKRLACEMATPVVNGDFIFGLSHYDSGRLFCLDARIGAIRWVGPPRTAEYATFLAIPGYVVVLLSTGELQILPVGAEEYRPVARYQVADSPTWAGPVLLTDGVLIKDHDSLTRWRFPESATPPTAGR